MQLERCKLYSGTLFYNTRFSTSLIHHIIFVRDNCLGTDIFTQNIYPIAPRKGKGYVIGGFLYPMNNILKEAGYGEYLTEHDRERMFSEDFEKIFLQSNLLENLEFYTDDPFYVQLYKQDPQFVKCLFTKNS